MREGRIPVSYTHLSNLLINGNFDTPLLNGALFHHSTFRDLFGLTGLSFTAGLRLDYEKMKMTYDSGTAMDYTGLLYTSKIELIPVRKVEEAFRALFG